MGESFAPFEEDFLRITADIVYCTLTTVDGNGRRARAWCIRYSRCRMGQPVGWLMSEYDIADERPLLGTREA